MPEVALLKIHKARYGTRVILNGQDLGEHQPCFTPGYFDLKGHVNGNGVENELAIRVGAEPGLPSAGSAARLGFREIPVHSRSVRFGGADPDGGSVHQERAGCSRHRCRHGTGRGRARGRPAAAEAKLSALVREARRGDAAGVVARTTSSIALAAGKTGTAELLLTIPNARLWSPEDPFLYELTLTTGTDSLSVRFGMRFLPL